MDDASWFRRQTGSASARSQRRKRAGVRELIRTAALLAVAASLRPAHAVEPAAPTRTTTSASAPAPRATPAPRASAADLEALHAYIRRSWTTLTRTHADLAVAAADPKFPEHEGPWPVYLAPTESLTSVSSLLDQVLPSADRARIVLRRLPRDVGAIAQHGLLYLPRPYVVPGGRFNEMYGWDSYFILRGLLRDGEIERARDLVDNFLYEVRRYGNVLNANRTYYLERSQPPFLAAMVRAVYARTRDRRWLAEALPVIVAHHRTWTTAPHLAGDTGLSRYRALGAGPAPEVVASERDAGGRTHYDRVRAAFRDDPPPGFDVARAYDRARDRLTPEFFVADRTMRESGFDPTARFGPFAAEILDIAPVCLNSLLHALESDTAAIFSELNRPGEARRWSARARRRAQSMRRLLWDPTRHVYTDYDFRRRQLRDYPFATSFFPLWSGLATADEAKQTAAVLLPQLIRPGGLSTSTRRSGHQWDAPFGWAPLHLLAVEGLRRHGLDAEADAISLAFLGTVLKEFLEHGAIFEKYDVERRESDVAAGLRFGYSSNEIGFGWTNAVFLELEAMLPPARRPEILDHASGRAN